MVVYVDQVVASNLIVNYVIIKGINVVFKDRTNVITLLIGLCLSLLSLGLFFVSSKYIYNLRYFIGIIIGLVVFNKGTLKEKIIKIVIYYLLNIAFIGTLVIFNIHNNIIMYVALLFVMVLWIIENYKSFVMNSKKLTYDIIIGKIKTKGYLDSGNQTYCKGLPVVFLKNKYFNSSFQYETNIVVSSINGNSTIDIYRGPLLKIQQREYIVYYAFVDNLNQDIILNWEMGD